MARASVREQNGGLRVRIEATGLRAGTYGAHLHTTGRCDAPDFASAGPHWNPTAAQHGAQNPRGTHKGDLPNLSVGADGRGTVEYLIAGATISGSGLALLDADGTALVLHERPDDYRTDPSGNSGARIACGVISRSGG
jgi:Cu-Zn family superoxide dismutase